MHIAILFLGVLYFDMTNMAYSTVLLLPFLLFPWSMKALFPNQIIIEVEMDEKTLHIIFRF